MLKTTAPLAIVLLIAASLTAQAQTSPDDGQPTAQTILITGANRGLGLEFARQFHAAGYRVIATARKPDDADELRGIGVRIVQLDVTDAPSVARLAADLKDEPLDILINNAGIGGRGSSIEDLDFDSVERVYAVNTLGPMRVTKALLSNLRAGKRKIVVNISSRLASLEGNGRGGYYGYRESKAALNMFTRSLSAELKPEGFTCIVMSPGWVRTDMGGPSATLSPEESIRGMNKVIDELTVENTGRFFSYDGSAIPW